MCVLFMNGYKHASRVEMRTITCTFVRVVHRFIQHSSRCIGCIMRFLVPLIASFFFIPIVDGGETHTHTNLCLRTDQKPL